MLLIADKLASKIVSDIACKQDAGVSAKYARFLRYPIAKVRTRTKSTSGNF